MNFQYFQLQSFYFTQVHCLVVSRLMFLKRDRGKALEIVKQNLSEAFMTQKEAFKFYIEDRNWKIYKKKLVDEIVKRRKRLHCTTFHDVPAVVRADNEHYFEDEKNDLLLRHKYAPKT